MWARTHNTIRTIDYLLIFYALWKRGKKLFAILILARWLDHSAPATPYLAGRFRCCVATLARYRPLLLNLVSCHYWLLTMLTWYLYKCRPIRHIAMMILRLFNRKLNISSLVLKCYLVGWILLCGIIIAINYLSYVFIQSAQTFANGLKLYIRDYIVRP